MYDMVKTYSRNYLITNNISLTGRVTIDNTQKNLKKYTCKYFFSRLDQPRKLFINKNLF